MKPKQNFCASSTKFNQNMGHRFINFVLFNVRSLVNTSRQTELSSLLYQNHLHKNKKITIPGYNGIYDYCRSGCRAKKKQLKTTELIFQEHSLVMFLFS